MSQRMQAVLLRFMETGEVQQVGAHSAATYAAVRLIAATNRELYAQVAAGAFRADLYYRLNVILIRVPPLRDRGDDVLLLLLLLLHYAQSGRPAARPALSRAIARCGRIAYGVSVAR